MFRDICKLGSLIAYTMLHIFLSEHYLFTNWCIRSFNSYKKLKYPDIYLNTQIRMPEAISSLMIGSMDLGESAQLLRTASLHTIHGKS